MYRAEIIAIGDELLRGDVENTTTPFIIEQIRSLGYDLIRTTTIGDETDRIARAVQSALGAAEIVILTGGLGPTPDDVTREALAKAIDQPLEFRPELWQEIQRLFEQRGKSTPPANINQAYLPYQCTGSSQLAGDCLWHYRPAQRGVDHCLARPTPGTAPDVHRLGAAIPGAALSGQFPGPAAKPRF